MKTQEILKNGAEVLSRHLDLVLATWTKGSRGQEWITWCVDEEDNAYWGHYFDSFEKAEADFVARIKKIY